MPAADPRLTIVVAALLVAACEPTCTTGPPHPDHIGVEVDARTPCLGRADADAAYHGRKKLTGGTIVSVDGDAARDDGKPAHESCCYPASFRVEGEARKDTLCLSVVVAGPNDEPDASSCPGAHAALDGTHILRWTRDGAVPLGVLAEHVDSLDGPPTVEDFVQGVDFCRWPASVSDESCG